MIEADNPLSTKVLPSTMKILIIPINPNSLGPSSLASTREAIKAAPFKIKKSVKVQRTPDIVCFFKDDKLLWIRFLFIN